MKGRKKESEKKRKEKGVSDGHIGSEVRVLLRAGKINRHFKGEG